MSTSDLIHIASAGDANAVEKLRSTALAYLDQLYDQGKLAGYWLGAVQGPEEAKYNFIDPDCLDMVERRYPFLYARVNVTQEAGTPAALATLHELGFVVAF
ncbi:MAG: hypothetical protein QOI38_2725 [Sphingomonadales bacterium]|jgi:muconolactone delta-isomerase|nr:hypothetical protein [Sphingomonadales bacterium]